VLSSPAAAIYADALQILSRLQSSAAAKVLIAHRQPMAQRLQTSLKSRRPYRQEAKS
jgi:hypothetical protein